MTKDPATKPTGAGKNSFGLIDTAKFFQELDLTQYATDFGKDETFLSLLTVS